MVHTYTPTYYTSLHDSITSICKNILPFSFKKKRLTAIAAAEQRLSQHQSDNLKWQQESFHQILKLMGLCKEGILPDTDVSAFRTYLLETLIVSPIDQEPSLILRDKLIFLQELFYTKCISEDEYHASKRPLLQRLAVQGAEIEASDVIVSTQIATSNEEWSVIDLKEEKTLMPKNKPKEGSALKKIKGAASAFGFITPDKNGKFEEKVGSEVSNKTFSAVDSNLRFRRSELGQSIENPFWNMYEEESESKSILMIESLPSASTAVKQCGSEKGKKKPFRILFQREGDGDGGSDSNVAFVEKEKSKKRTWGFDGFKKWKKNETEDETAPLSIKEKSDGATCTGLLVENPIGEGPHTKQMKKKLHPAGAPTDFFVDKVLAEKIKKELSHFQAELRANNQNVDFSDDQIEVISTRLPVDKADLKKYFPKSWCDQYGDLVLHVVRKEFKDHVGEMGSSRAIVREKNNSKRWTTFDEDDEENYHPNLFAPQQDHSYSMMKTSFSASKNVRASFNNSSSSSIDKGFKYNPFFDM